MHRTYWLVQRLLAGRDEPIGRFDSLADVYTAYPTLACIGPAPGSKRTARGLSVRLVHEEEYTCR